MQQLHARHHLEHFSGKVTCSARAKRSEVDFAGIGFGVSNELRNGPGRKAWKYFQHKRRPDQGCDRPNIASEIEVEFVGERCIDRVGRRDDKKGVAVGRSAHYGCGGEIGAGARHVLHDESDAESL